MTEYSEQAGPAERRQIRYDPRRGRGDEIYRQAERHSRLVKRLKFILPVLAVAGAAVFWGSARFIPGNLTDLVAIAGIDAKSNSVVMDKPHISGFEGTRRAYEVKADSAVQSLDDPKVVTFNEIDAHLGLDDAGTATVDAQTGVYDGNDNTLLLKNGIDIKTTSGYAASFVEAAINLGKGSLVSTRPIEIRTKEGTIRANGLEVSDRGKRIIFRNGVSVTYLPQGELAAAPAGDALPAAPAKAPEAE